MASFAEWTEQEKKKKKKKEPSAEGVSFTEYTKQVLGRDDIEAPLSERKEEEDIAPVKNSGGGGDFGGSGSSRSFGEGEKGDFWDWLGDSAMSGLAAFNKGITSTVDVILGKPLQALGWEHNPISSVANHYDRSYDYYKEQAKESTSKMGGGGYGVASEIVEGTVSALPDALMALATMGTSYAPSAVNLATQATYRTSGLLTKAGLTVSSMAKNPQFWLSFARTYGNDYEEALETMEKAENNKKAKAEFLGEEYEGDSESKTAKNQMIAAFTATITSLVNAGIEIGIDGGSGFQGLPDKIKGGDKSAIRAWVESALEEGGEEVLQGFVNDIVAKVSYDPDREVLDPQKMAKEFGMGTAVGLALGGGQIAVQSGINAGVNAVQKAEASKLTENEQKVFDKEVENRIAEEEANGEKITPTKRAEIIKDVKTELEKGYIPTDTIESVLGGETYKTYKDTIDSEDALQSEFDTLNKMKQGEMTGEQIDRRAELKQQLEELKNNSQRDQLKQQLSDEVFGIVNGSRLVESYNERARRGTAFEADLSKYDAKQQAVVQKAVESGILNNTNRTHEFVDMVAKISADKGVLFDFTNNAKLKESGFAVDGKSVNGYVTKDGITVNMDSNKYVNSVVGHEITHVLEGTELYTELQSAVMAYAKSKNDYQGRYDALTELYKDIDGADIDAELTADLVGDYLFTDSDFINRLSTENRNVFQKIYDEIKYLCKVATAGSKEARELEKVKKAFEDAYRVQKNTATDGGGKTQYSLGEYTQAQKDNWGKSKRIVLYESDAQVREFVHKAATDGSYVQKMYFGTITSELAQEIQEKTGLDVEGRNVTLRADNVRKILRKHGNEVKENTINQRAVTEDDFAMIPDVIGSFDDLNLSEKGYNGKPAILFNKIIDNSLYTVLAVDSGGSLDLFVQTMYVGKKTGSIANVTNANALISTPEAPVGIAPESIIPQNSEKSSGNTKHSLSDNDGKQLTKEQQDYFKDSKVRDESGNLKVVYHGTSNGGFTVFKRNVNFFTDSKEMADSYSPNGDMYEGYVNITKPYEIDAKGEKWSRIPIDDATKNFLQEQGASVFEEDGEWRTTPADIASAIEEAVDNGDMDCDGIIIRNVDDTGSYYKGNNNNLATDYIVFNSNQFKNRDNISPTTDPDIRFSLSESVEETKDLIAAHNLHANELLKQLDMGGMPMPSIAVTKADSVHNEYGDVTLVLHKSAIDPKSNKANKVYGGDVWSPTYPKIEYKPNDAVEQKITSKYNELYRKYGYEDTRPMYRYANDLEDTLTGRGGETALLEELYDDTGMMQVYLLDTGKGKVETVQEEVRTELSDAEVEMNEFFIDELGADVVDGVMVSDGGNPMLHRKQYWEQHGEKIKETYKKLLSQEYGFTEEEVKNVLDNTKTFDYLKFVRDAHKYRRNGRVTTRTEPNQAATQDAIRKAASKGYKEWVDNLFKGVEEKSGIRNNTDYFTPSGNRRSWDALHWENTLENVVRVMKSQDNGDGVFFSGHGIWGVAAKEYKSIADVKNDADRLKHLPEEEYEKIRGELGGRLQEIAENIMDKGERNQFIAADNALSCIVDAVRHSKTESGILNNLKQYKQLTVTPKDVADIVSLVNDIANMPTGYFEAKPQRAVGFDEVAVFVIPRDADVTLKQELLNRGYAIAEYDPQIEGDRQRVVNQFEEYKFSLSNVGETSKPYVNYRVSGKDLLLEQEVAPVAETNTETVDNTVPDGFAPITEEEAESLRKDSFASIDDADMPPEVEPSYSGEKLRIGNPLDLFANRDIDEVGNRKVKAYMYENPEVKPFFQEAAYGMLYDLQHTVKGERWYDDKLYYESGGELGFSGVKRHTTDDIAYLLDNYHYTYDQIEAGLNAIIEDNGAENNAVSKRIEFMLNDRLKDGYTGVFGEPIPRDENYVKLLEEKQINEYSKEAFESLLANADDYAPYVEEEVAPHPADEVAVEDIAPVAEVPETEAVTPDIEQTAKVAEVMDAEPETQKRKRSVLAKFKTDFLDKGAVFEDLSLKTKNRELIGKWNHTLSAESRAQWLIGKGTRGVKSLNSIREEVERTGKTKQFFEYVYHKHNIDRMSLESEENRTKREKLRKQFKGYSDNQIRDIALEWITKETPEDAKARIKAAREYVDTLKGKNKPVFGDAVTADVSREVVERYEAENPEFKAFANDVYGYMNHLRDLMVENGVISKETAELWSNMYPYFVPIRRLGDEGLNINVPLDTMKTGVNAPIKGATGGNRDILPLFDTMAMRTEQTYKAIARNSFGLELKNTLKSTIASEETSVDDIFDSIDTNEELLQEGKDGKNPTFTVFDNGKRVTFEITEDMYDALKPTSDRLAYTNKVANTASNVFRGLLTEYNPVFMLTNAAKDIQDVLLNSQHATKTYATIPQALSQIVSKGKWYTEYMENGGEQNTYFDKQTNTFEVENNLFKKTIGLPLRAISEANNFIEKLPRLAEYIASRKSGASVEVAMLDAGRVTTNFAAGGDVTKFLNRNGFTFLNASTQGFMQQVRNVREAKANGLKGWVQLATKFALAGLPAILLNNLLWDDDEEYEELSGYVKQNYYVVAKFGDGKFVRIPKGRAVAVIQNAFEQMNNLRTGDDEIDLNSFLELAISNLAPNNPLENNIIAPIMQVANNETWYGEALVPTRLQDLPQAEQYDESTDSISRWLGEKLNFSPYKINYLLNQYSGGVGDVVLPMLTPEAESGDNSPYGNVIAPLKDKFTTDSVMNNQNVSDFYDKVDELTANAKSRKATDEDILKSKYINSVNSDLGELYAEKREIQNSSLADDAKYAQVRSIQQQIDELAKESLNTYNNVTINGKYATVGDTHYRWYEPSETSDAEAGWQKITDKQLEKQEEVTSGLGISASEYWSNKEEYDYAYEYPENYAVAKSVGGYEAYKTYSSELYDIKADKDENGKSITGSRKEKVIEYVNNLDVDDSVKFILFKNEYNADDTYNYEIIDYLNEREDISYVEMETILKKLGFTVSADGTISW